MATDDFQKDQGCKKERIAAFFDGDLTPLDSLAVEEHVEDCEFCSEYLRSLRLVSTSLEIFLEEKKVEIPGEFSKRVTAAAESNMDGLRSKKERSRAVLVCAGLLVAAAVLLTISAVGVGTAIDQVPGKFMAVVGFFGHLFYSVATAFSVVFGTVCARVFFGSTVAVLLVLAILFFSILIFSKHMLRFHRS